jgi:tetratricopeptide (TPR) repeat protein
MLKYYLFLFLSCFGILSRAQEASMDLDPSDALKAEASLIEGEKFLMLENFPKAKEVLAKAEEIDPNNGAIKFKLAEVSVKLNDQQLALEYIDEAIKLEPQNKYYYIFKGEVLKATNNFESAIKNYERLIEQIPGNEEYLFDLALLYQFTGKSKKALETFDQAEAFFGISEMLVKERQKIHLKRNDLEALVEDWEKLINEYPDEPNFVLELSSILLSNGEYQLAEDRLNDLLSLFPENENAHLLLAKVSIGRGNFQEALIQLKRPIGSTTLDLSAKVQTLNELIAQVLEDEALIDEFTQLTDILVETHPESFQALAFAGDVQFQVKQNQQAIRYYLEAIELQPASFSVWQNIVNLSAQLQNYEDVVKYSEKALEYFPNQAVFYYFNGIGNYLTNDFKSSVRSLETGVKYASDPQLLTSFYGQMGDAYNSLKSYQKSNQAYEKALEYDPNNDHVLNNYAYFLSLRKESLDKAASMSGRLVNQYPDNPTYLDTHGWVLYAQGKYKEAESYLFKAATLEQDGTILEHYGDVLYQLGKVSEAIEQWKMAQELGGGSDQLEKKISDEKLYE